MNNFLGFINQMHTLLTKLKRGFRSPVRFEKVKLQTSQDESININIIINEIKHFTTFLLYLITA